MTISRTSLALIAGLALAFPVGSALFAQSEADGGYTAADNSGSFEVNGIHVDVTGKTSEDAREAGWRIAQRKGWSMLSKRLTGHDGSLSDSALDSLVSAIVIDKEEIGPNRYIADLGVTFSRARAGSILGVATQVTRSAPMLIVPVQWSGGVGTTLERDTAWQDAWSRFRSGGSSIDYLRPAGTGPDPLLINAGQVSRRGRGWWRTVLRQYGASDVLIPQVRIMREWPGGPIIATFTAGHGPDNTRITQFSLRVENGDALDALLDEGVKRINAAYEKALNDGALRVDPLLTYRPPQEEQQQPDEADQSPEVTETPTPSAPSTPAANSLSVNIQFDSPSAGSVTSAEAVLRGIPGVSSAVTTSLALGGVSVMQVSYQGSVQALRSALESRGYQVSQGGNTLRISRPSAPSGGGQPSNAAGG
ncbi:heavy-metal-associated domain-containing protein [Stakelama marina]|uniref:Heavy-metal-associated domain-containing protein n=1 Tax=Stakelama marina TaxID=2826939 RepID=A0A8T4IB29_9SPHN|nr:heavy-metal-associated domain-containing protein [Stakelama marina]MBR0551613.1 heavy-metal-associated domain-containing protein [Stakelama marina]